MTINNRPIPSIQQVHNQHFKNKPINPKGLQTGQSFDSILKEHVNRKEELKFSKHANARLEKRDIHLSDKQIERLENGVEKAEAKGIKESLMLMDNIALVVNVENKTVVTALDHSETREHVFTNIDGAVVL